MDPSASDSDGCIICYEDITPASRAVISGCLHEFCYECITSWTKTSLACPLCKQEFASIHHSFAEDGTSVEEVLGIPAAAPVDVGEQLNCLDHAFFLAEVTRLLQGAERAHRDLWLEGRSARGLNVVERRHLETAESVCMELRNHKRRLQGLLHFDPHATLQDLYRLQGLIDNVWRDPSGRAAGHHAQQQHHHHHQQQQHQSSGPAPVRYSADDAWEGNVSDEDEELAEDMQYLSLARSSRHHTPKPIAYGKQAKHSAKQQAKAKSQRSR